jgi:predicted permease
MEALDVLWTDVRRGARGLARAPGFAAVAIATLAIGIGANTAIFSVVNAVLLRPLPYSRPESRVMIWSRWEGFDKTWLSEVELLDYGRLCQSFARVAGWSSGQSNLTGDGEAVRIGTAGVTASTFATLGSEPLIGRTFTPEEDRPGASAVAVISHGLWQRRYGGDPTVVGRTIVMDGVPRRVLGVMPAEFQLPTDFGEDAAEPTEVWVPLAIDVNAAERGDHGLYGAAELMPGVTAERASAELATIAANWTREGLYPEPMRFSPFAVPIEQEILGAVRPAMLLLFGAVTFLLLIACANVAHLLLARAEGRQREIALRAALGAGRGRVLGQVFAESLVLAAPSAVLAVVLAYAGLRVLLAAGSVVIPRAAGVAIDARVLLFTLLAAVATSVLFSLAPALRAFGLNLTEALRDGSPNATAGGRRQRLRGLLVVAETALSVVLLLGAGLMLRSLWALQRIDMGFDPRQVMTARLALPEVGYEDAGRVSAFYRQLLERVRALPEVRHAGLVRSLPLASQIGDWGLQIEGRQPPPGQNAKGDWQVVSDGGIEALGERLVSGRLITAADSADAQQVALVNETLARTYWPGQDPLGKRLRQGSSEERPWVTVVGVVADVRHNGLRSPIKEKFYRPHAQFHVSTGFPLRNMTLVVKSRRAPLAPAAPVREIVRTLDPNVPVASVRAMEDVVRASLSTQRLAGALLGAFAALALVLAAVGTYGVLAYLVSQRTQEIGIRVAIGATAGHVMRMVLARGASLALVGIAAGSLAALALGRLMTSMLHEVRPHDPLTFVVVPVVLAAVAVAASYIPARRATRVDPMTALRVE